MRMTGFKKGALGLLVAWCISTPALAQEHDELAAALAMHIVDWRQTVYIAQHRTDFHEKNPLLGLHPSIGRTNNYFLATGALMTAAHFLLPPEYAVWSTRVWLVVGTGAVARNISLGVKTSF